MAKRNEDVAGFDVDILCEDLISEVKAMDFIFNSPKIWSTIESFPIRKKSYSYWYAMIEQNLSNLHILCKLAEQNDISETKRIKDIVESWMGMFENHQCLCNLYFDKYPHEELTKLTDMAMQNETTFRLSVKQDLVSIKSLMKKIDSFLGGKEFRPKSLGNKPIPLVMRPVVEGKHPALREQMEKKLSNDI